MLSTSSEEINNEQRAILDVFQQMDDESEDERIESEFRVLFIINNCIKPFSMCIGLIFIVIITIGGIQQVIDRNGSYFSCLIQQNMTKHNGSLEIEQLIISSLVTPKRTCAVDYCHPFRVLYLIHGDNFEVNYSSNSDIVFLSYNESNVDLLKKYSNHPRITVITDNDKKQISARNRLYNYSIQNELNLTQKSINETCLYKYFAFMDENEHIDINKINYTQRRYFENDTFIDKCIRQS